MILPCLHMASSPSQANWRNGSNPCAFLISFGGGVSLHTATDSEPGLGVLSRTPNPSKPAPVRTLFSRAIGSSQHAKGQMANCQKRIQFIHERLSSSAEKVGTGGFRERGKVVQGRK